MRRVSAIVRNPRSITFREMMIFGFIAMCLWRLGPVISDVRVVIRIEASDLCPRLGLVGCARRYFGVFMDIFWAWVGEWIIWLPIVALVIFVGEELNIDKRLSDLFGSSLRRS